MPQRPALWTGLVLVLGGFVVATLSRAGSGPPLPTTLATLAWIHQVVDFGARTGDTAPEDAGPLAGRLEGIVALDPEFDEAWTGGTLMLRVVEGGQGPHGRAWDVRRQAHEEAR